VRHDARHEDGREVRQFKLKKHQAFDVSGEFTEFWGAAFAKKSKSSIYFLQISMRY
jgi:hypothetical protein